MYSPSIMESGGARQTDDSPISHGSCVMSKAIGAENGVYKNAISEQIKNSRLVVLKMDPTNYLAETFWAFEMILRELTKDPLRKAAVVVYPFTSEITPMSATTQQIISEMMNRTMGLGCSIVVPSGNNGRNESRRRVDTFPAILESPEFPLIVVGAVNNNGQVAAFSQGPNQVTVWAPGVDVVCSKKNGVRRDSGTSYAVGMVSLQPAPPRFALFSNVTGTD